MLSKISSFEWSSWLQEIHENPKHRVITEKGFLTKDNSTKALSSIEIIKISKLMLAKPQTTLCEHQKILVGMEHIIASRESKFRKLNFIFRGFSNLFKGIGKAISLEKQEIKKLRESLNAKISSHSLNYTQSIIDDFKNLKQKFLISQTKLNEKLFQISKELYHISILPQTDEEEKNRIELLQEQIYAINPRLPSAFLLAEFYGKDCLKNTLQETVFHLAIHYPSDKINLDRDCKLFNCDAVEMQAIYIKRLIKVAKIENCTLSTVAKIEECWQELISSKKEESVEKEIDDYRVIFIPKKGEEGIYLKKKFLKDGSYKAAFLAISLFDKIKPMAILQPLKVVKQELDQMKKKGLLPKGKEDIASETSEPNTPKKKKDLNDAGKDLNKVSKSATVKKDVSNDADLNTVVIGGGDLNTVVIGGGDLNTVVIGGGKPDKTIVADDDSGTMVISGATKLKKKTILKPKDDPKKDVVIKKPGASLVSTLKDKKDKGEKDIYVKEAKLCLLLGKDPGIWPTHQITTVNGEIAIIQKVAGYQSQQLNQPKAIEAIDLSQMAKLSMNKLLPAKDQGAYLKMIGDFLIGVHSLHKRGIIHRDLKPDNVLCSANGGSGIIDFGISCYESILDGSGKMVPNPEKKGLAGTNYYIPPEIAISESNPHFLDIISTKADIWSTGIILWELLSGQEVHTHPALPFPSPFAYVGVGELLNPLAGSGKAYKEAFPKPSDKDSILYLIWRCTRAKPSLRPNIEEVKQRFDKWANQVQDKLNKKEIVSIHDVFEKEYQEYATKDLKLDA